MTERATLAKWLRASAKYHRQHRTPVVVSMRALSSLKAHGVSLELPARGYPGELTPDQADRYAAAIEATH